MKDPDASLDALIDPPALTLGQLAILERIDSPLLTAESWKIADVAPGLWILSLPVKEAAKRWREADVEGIAYVDQLTPHEYADKLAEAFTSVAKFLEIMPPAGEAERKKKEPETV